MPVIQQLTFITAEQKPGSLLALLAENFPWKENRLDNVFPKSRDNEKLNYLLKRQPGIRNDVVEYICTA